MSMTTEEAQRSIVEICAFSKLSTLSGLKGVVADPKDDMVIDCAVTGGATHIVSGDKKHLLPIGEYQGIKIVSPAEFLGMVGQGD